MSLVIRAVSLEGKPLTRVIRGVFGAAGGTIGRSDAATLSLPDPMRLISRVHAEVVFDATGYVLVNTARAAPILCNEMPLAPGRRIDLHAGDELQLGAYRLEVQEESAGTGPAPA